LNNDVICFIAKFDVFVSGIAVKTFKNLLLCQNFVEFFFLCVWRFIGLLLASCK